MEYTHTQPVPAQTLSLMFHCHRVRALFNLNTISQLSSSSTPLQCYLSLQPISHKIFFSTTSQSNQQQSFTISYLTRNCGLSPQAALKASKRVRFDTAQKPDSVIAFFLEQGFSTSQVHSVITSAPELLTCDPIKRVLPKFQFLASKGASTHDIVTTVTRSPAFLCRSLDKQVIPAFELIRRFFPCDAKAIARVLAFPLLIGDARFETNLNLLLDFGVTHTHTRYLLSLRPYILHSSAFREALEEVKGLGFDPRKRKFIQALLAKKAIAKSKWDAKIDVLRKWGWSDDAIFQSFRRHPILMLCSKDKMNAIISFWVGQLGWDSSTLQAAPKLFSYQLEKRIIPRASIIQYLLSKGLMKKGASLIAPFCLTDKMFLQKFVTCFGEEETSRLLEIYQGGCYNQAVG